MLRLLHSWSSFSLAHVPHPRSPSPQSSGRGRGISVARLVKVAIGSEGKVEGRAGSRGSAGGSRGFREQG